MISCKTLTLIHSSLPSFHYSNPNFLNSSPVFPFSILSHSFSAPLFRSCRIHPRHYSVMDGALAVECSDDVVENSQDCSEKIDSVKHLLSNRDDVYRLMKMDRRSPEIYDVTEDLEQPKRWFPYLDKFNSGEGDVFFNSGEVLDAVGPHIMEEQKKRFRNAVENRSYSVCLVVEGVMTRNWARSYAS